MILGLNVHWAIAESFARLADRAALAFPPLDAVDSGTVAFFFFFDGGVGPGRRAPPPRTTGDPQTLGVSSSRRFRRSIFCFSISPFRAFLSFSPCS